MWAGRNSRDLDRVSSIRQNLLQSAAWPRSLAIGMLTAGLAAPAGLAISVMTASEALAECTVAGVDIACVGETGVDAFVDGGGPLTAGVTIAPGTFWDEVNNSGTSGYFNLNVSGNDDNNINFQATSLPGTPTTLTNPGTGLGIHLLSGVDGTVDVWRVDPDVTVTSGNDALRLRSGGAGGTGTDALTGTGTVRVTSHGTFHAVGNASNDGQGIDAKAGSGGVHINILGGSVTSDHSDGIVAEAGGSGVTWGDVNIMTAAGTTVTGGAVDGAHAGTDAVGIWGFIMNPASDGNVTITANGEVNGFDDAIRAQTTQGDATVNVGSTAVVTGGTSGTAGDGVHAFSTDGGNVYVNVAAGAQVSGDPGIVESAVGDGTVGLDTAGDVSGDPEHAVETSSVDGATNIRMTGGSLASPMDGINATVTGTGAATTTNATIAGLFINQTGGTIGTSGTRIGGTGINATMSGVTTNDLVVNSNTIFSVQDGVLAQMTNAGASGNVIVNVNGDIDSSTNDGVDARNFGTGNTTVEAWADINAGNGGGDSGIEALTFGGGNVQVTTHIRSDITGPNFGIDARATGGAGAGMATLDLWGDVDTGSTELQVWTTATTGSATINIHRPSDINAGGSSSDLVILGNGGPVNVNIWGDVLGRINLSAAGGDGALQNVVNNYAATSWQFTGTSEFGGGNNDVFNNTGQVIPIDPGGVADTADFAGLEFFNNGAPGFGNNGYINQRDGVIGDRANVMATSGDTTFYGSPGNNWLLQDVDLGTFAESDADRFKIYGNVNPDGSTGIVVDDLNNNAGAYNPNGVTVVDVTGTTGLGDFFLEHGPINKGLWTYDLFLNPNNNSAPDGDGSSKNCDDADNCWVIASYLDNYSIPQTMGIVQGMWHDGSWIERASDLRTVYGSNGGAGADLTYEAPVSVPTVHSGNSGIWGRVIGQIANRDVSYETEPFPYQYVTVDADYEEHFGAVQGGIDHAFDHGNGTTVVGLLAGYAHNSVDFIDAGDTAKITAPHVGAYVNWLNGGTYVDAMVKADFLTVDLNVAGEDATTKGHSLGGRLEAGHRHQMGQAFVEPVAMIAYVRTQLDPVTIGMTDVTFEDGQSLRGKVGGRVGFTTMSNGMQVDPYVHAYVGSEFLGKNTVFFDSGPGLTVIDDVSGIFGEVGGGFNLTTEDKHTSFYGQANYIFADGYHAGNATVGARVNW